MRKRAPPPGVAEARPATRIEVAYLVLHYLKEMRFAKALKEFKAEAKDLLSVFKKKPRSPKSLEDILNEYLDVMTERSQLAHLHERHVADLQAEKAKLATEQRRSVELVQGMEQLLHSYSSNWPHATSVMPPPSPARPRMIAGGRAGVSPPMATAGTLKRSTPVAPPAATPSPPLPSQNPVSISEVPNTLAVVRDAPSHSQSQSQPYSTEVKRIQSPQDDEEGPPALKRQRQSFGRVSKRVECIAPESAKAGAPKEKKGFSIIIHRGEAQIQEKVSSVQGFHVLQETPESVRRRGNYIGMGEKLAMGEAAGEEASPRSDEGEGRGETTSVDLTLSKAVTLLRNEAHPLVGPADLDPNDEQISPPLRCTTKSSRNESSAPLNSSSRVREGREGGERDEREGQEREERREREERAERGPLSTLTTTTGKQHVKMPSPTTRNLFPSFKEDGKVHNLTAKQPLGVSENRTELAKKDESCENSVHRSPRKPPNPRKRSSPSSLTAALLSPGKAPMLTEEDFGSPMKGAYMSMLMLSPEKEFNPFKSPQKELVGGLNFNSPNDNVGKGKNISKAAPSPGKGRGSRSSSRSGNSLNVNSESIMSPARGSSLSFNSEEESMEAAAAAFPLDGLLDDIEPVSSMGFFAMVSDIMTSEMTYPSRIAEHINGSSKAVASNGNETSAATELASSGGRSRGSAEWSEGEGRGSEGVACNRTEEFHQYLNYGDGDFSQGTEESEGQRGPSRRGGERMFIEDVSLKPEVKLRELITNEDGKTENESREDSEDQDIAVDEILASIEADPHMAGLLDALSTRPISFTPEGDQQKCAKEICSVNKMEEYASEADTPGK